jgi:RNase P/RNase MRP subunit p29
MKEYVGHEMKLVVQGFPSAVKGKMVNEDQQMVYLESASSKEIWRIPKGKICAFTVMDSEPEPFVPLLVLNCSCPKTGCPGVQYVKKGSGFTLKDIEVFTDGCPMKSDDCRMGSKGEIRTLSSNFLDKMLCGMLFGDYPEKKKEVKRVKPSGRTSAKTKRGSSES